MKRLLFILPVILLAGCINPFHTYDARLEFHDGSVELHVSGTDDDVTIEYNVSQNTTIKITEEWYDFSYEHTLLAKFTTNGSGTKSFSLSQNHRYLEFEVTVGNLTEEQIYRCRS